MSACLNNAYYIKISKTVKAFFAYIIFFGFFVENLENTLL